MKKRFILLFLILTIFVVSGYYLQFFYKQTDNDNNFNKDLRLAISKRLLEIDSNDIYFPHLKDYLEIKKFFYTNNSFNPIILKSTNHPKIIDSILFFLENAYLHGINPKIYFADVIKSELDKSTNKNLTYDQRNYHLANLELILVNSILNYSHHLKHGLVNPNKIFLTNFKIPQRKFNPLEILDSLKDGNVLSFLENIQPKSNRYIKLQNAFLKYSKLINKNWEAIPIPKKKIEPGQKFEYIDNIVHKLIILGLVDTNVFVDAKRIKKYDVSLVEPIKKFQRSHGLIEDGIIGKTTIERLNIPPKVYLDKIKINLERFRWSDYSDTNKYVLVNIPEFNLYVYEDKKVIGKMKVAIGKIGKISKEKDWKTPVLYSQISHLILNPTWTVPQSIVEEEIVEELTKDSLYLKKRNFIAYKKGKAVSLDEITIENLLTKNYTLVQQPGSGNALGRIKFMFDNEFGVYLHDSPTRAPFDFINRAVSHGCVRVEKPYSLAEFLIRDNSLWNINYIKIETNFPIKDKQIINEFRNIRNQLRKEKKHIKSTTVKLLKPIPLFIDYYTAWVDDNNVLNYREDIYKYDQLLLASLKM